MQKLTIFCNFVNDYLGTNPPSTMQPMGSSYGVKLVTGESFTIGNADQTVRGSMQPSTQQHVTGRPAEIAEAYGQSPDSSVLPGNALPIGQSTPTDLTQNQGSKTFGQ